MKRLVPCTLLVALLAGCASTSDLEETRRQLDLVNRQASTRLSEVEAKLANEKLLEMVGQVEAMKAEVTRLRGELETQQYALATTQKRQNDLYNDLDGRLTRLEGGGSATSADPAAPAAPSGPAATTPPAVPVLTPAAQDYDRALGMLRNREFPAAIDLLRRISAQYPATQQGIEAQYWLGVAHTALRQYDAAIDIHRRFAEQHPDHAKAPDALRNVANCQRDLGQNDQAKATLRKLIKQYPTSAAAHKARELLPRL